MNKKLINTINLYFILTILFSQVFSYSLCAKPISYKLDTNNSKVGFSVKHKITRDVFGEFLKSVGTADYNSNTDKIFNVITIEDPFPIPFSVIKSLNQRIIIDPVVRARTISLHIAKFQLNKIGRNEKAIEKLSKIVPSSNA